MATYYDHCSSKQLDGNRFPTSKSARWSGEQHTHLRICMWVPNTRKNDFWETLLQKPASKNNAFMCNREFWNAFSFREHNFSSLC